MVEQETVSRRHRDLTVFSNLQTYQITSTIVLGGMYIRAYIYLVCIYCIYNVYMYACIYYIYIHGIKKRAAKSCAHGV